MLCYLHQWKCLPSTDVLVPLPLPPNWNANWLLPESMWPEVQVGGQAQALLSTTLACRHLPLTSQLTQHIAQAVIGCVQVAWHSLLELTTIKDRCEQSKNNGDREKE